MMESENIVIKGARQHNLKNIDVTIPRNALSVITGLSGSGKSTLAFDTLYAEGQRRYVESLSAYARQFLERLEKPDVDSIEGLSPAIAIEQKTGGHNPRSTVGTVTEIYDYLRLLFARIGEPYCYKCGRPITSQTIDQIVENVMGKGEGTKIIILAPKVADQKGTHEKLLQKLKKDGFARVRIDGEIVEIEDAKIKEKNKKHNIEVVVDRLVIKESIKSRLTDSLELAASLSEGVIMIEEPGKKTELFSEKAACINCQISYPKLTPASFSFNSPQGACHKCAGLGTVAEFDPDLIIPNKMLSLREGAVAPWANRNSVYFIEFIDSLTSHYKTDIYTPYDKLPESFKEILLNGSGKEPITFYFERKNRRFTYKKPFEGVIPNLKRKYLETDSYEIREEIKHYMNFKPCSECKGSKLNPISGSIKIGGLSISKLTELSVQDAQKFFADLNLIGKNKFIAHGILKEISERLGFLSNVGLDYLTLDRTASTLSGGESQRIRLATQIGSKLTGVLYVLDEPSIGLHQRDNRRLLDTLVKMRDIGNTVLVVEHDEETVMAADYVVDMGPGAGINGGNVVFAGTPKKLCDAKNSLTGLYISGKKKIEVPKKRRKGSGKNLIIEGAKANNLKDITVKFPLGCFICVTGVSGSGKSTLVLETLYNSIVQHLYRSKISAGTHTGIKGLEFIDKVVNIDQSPIGRTPRSNPGTYTGVFSYIRELFSKTADAQIRGYKPGRFSFNVKGGRCEECQGDGIIKIEMHFLPDVYVACDACNGKRYNKETLEIKYKGKNISEILDMTVDMALEFFKNIKTISSKLDTLSKVGMGYVRIGQPATTLSGGEAQRIKLSRELGKRATGRTLYILDEPTTGLHTDDVKKLLSVLHALVDAGNTVVVIEHNLDVIKTADYIIDLGPEGGEKGGTVIAKGTPENIVKIKESYTGHFLEKYLVY